MSKGANDQVRHDYSLCDSSTCPICAVERSLEEPGVGTDLIAAVRKHAVDHYNDGGWDVIVECWEDVDIVRYILGCRKLGPVDTPARAIKAFEPLVDVWADRQADARIEGAV